MLGALAESCLKLRNSVFFDRVLIAVIIVASIVVGIETYPAAMLHYGGLLHALDLVILVVFAVEALIKILAEGKRPWRYFQNGWNIFDFTILVACLMPYLVAAEDMHYMAVFRLIRILRVLRLISSVPKLQFLVNILLKAFPSFGYVGVLLFLLFYVYATLGVFLFSGNDPVHFGDLQTALLTLFRIVTFEDWTDIMYIQKFGSDVYATGMEFYSGAKQPHAYGWFSPLYFVSFVIFGSLVVLNLFIGVIVNSIHEINDDISAHAQDLTTAENPTGSSATHTKDKLLKTIQKLEDDLANLKKEL